MLTNYAGFYYLQNEAGDLFTCKIRGKLKHPVITGDWVEFLPTDEEQGMIETVLPRINQLDRPRIANTSLALIVLAMDEPKPDLFLLDRLLWLVQFNRIKPCIVLTKSDLTPHDNADKILQYYKKNDFSLLTFSNVTGQGLSEVQEAVNREITVLSGPSGVGKTSLLNSLLPGVSQRTQAISRKMGRGKHTTRHVELYPLPTGGWLADTPGFSALELPAADRLEVAGFFPDFSVYAEDCRFRNCLHHKENECGVKAAAERGEILQERYDHYVMMLAEILAKEKQY